MKYCSRRDRRGSFRRLAHAGLILVLGVASMATSTGSQAQDEPLSTAEQILDRYIEVTGGRAAYEKLENQLSQGTMEIGGIGIKGKLTSYAARPDRTYSVVELEGIGKIESGTGDDVAWELSVLEGARLREGDEKASALRAAVLFGELHWRRLYQKAECVGMETIEGRLCDKVVLTPPTGKPETRYFARESGLLVKTATTLATPMGEIPVESLLSDYRPVDGVLIAHKTVSTVLTQQMIITLESVQHNVEIPPGRFDPPAEIKALIEEARKKQQAEPDAEPGTGPKVGNEEASAAAEARLTPEQQQANLASFDTIWITVRDKHWDPALGGLDWEEVRNELRPRVEQAETMSQARAPMEEMLERLGETHFSVIPAEIYERMAPETPEEEREGDTGLEVRVIDRQALVTRVEQPAADAQVRTGWQILTVGDTELAPILAEVSKLYEGKALQDLALTGVVSRRLGGKVGATLKARFLNGDDQVVEVELPLATPRGNLYRLGNLPAMPTWIESRRLHESVGYIRFNAFMDPIHLLPAFEQAVRSFADCKGLIIDVRGNIGGLGAMVMGMTGWFIEGQGQSLGTLATRETQLRLVVNPRTPRYTGRLAVLIDGCSASAAEMFAGGLQDLGRARIFGSRTAGAALPSVIEKLPNGDGFQYAFANYTSAQGRRLEGNGVTPDQEVRLTRAALLEGRDPVIEAAVAWIEGE